MRSVLLVVTLLIFAIQLQAQLGSDCLNIPSTPTIEDGFVEDECDYCGDCSGVGAIPPITAIEQIENLGQGNVMALGIETDSIRQDYDEVIADLDSIDQGILSGDQVAGLAEYIDNNIDFEELMKCTNFNCRFNLFDDFGPGLEYNSFFDDIDEYINNLSPEERDEVNAALAEANNTGACPSGDYLACLTANGSLGDNPTFQEILRHELDDLDINQLISDYFGITDYEDNPACIIIGDITSGDSSNDEKVLANGNDVQGEQDLFNWTIPGTSNAGPEQLLPSPASIDLSSNVSRNVNLYNGLPSVSVPIHEIVANDISIPISVSMSNPAVKVDDMGSEVGNNWMLNAGGAITRTVNNLPDEYHGTRKIGRGRGPVSELSPCVGFDIGGINLFTPPRVVNWSPFQPNVIRYNIRIHTIFISLGIITIPIHIYVSSIVRLDVRLKPDYYTMEEKGVGYLNLKDSEIMSNLLGLAPVSIKDFVEGEGQFSLPDAKENLLRAANGRVWFEEISFINTTAGLIKQFGEGIQNLFGVVNKKFSTIDLQPDEFAFSFGGYSGKFMFTEDGEIMTKPVSALEITPRIETIEGAPHIISFEVETPEGLVYTFGQSSSGVPAGIKNVEGTEFSEHITYTLPNYLTYPEGASTSSLRDPYQGAGIQEAGYGFRGVVGCFPRALMYGNTYENLYTSQRSNKYASTWKLTKVRSLMTQEGISLSYQNTYDAEEKDFRYFSSKSLGHAFPNFGVNSDDHTPFETYKNRHLNPLNDLVSQSEYVNHQPQFTYTAVETRFNKQRLISINTDRLESAVFSYNNSRLDLVGDKLLEFISIERNGTNYRKYLFTYGSNETIVSIGCSNQEEVVGETIPTSPQGFTYTLNEPHRKWLYNVPDISYLSFRLNGITIFRFPWVIPTRPTEGQNQKILDEYGSIIHVKELERLANQNDDIFGEGATPIDHDAEQAIFAAEGKRTFLDRIEIEGNDGALEPYVSFTYNSLGSKFPKRFSTKQDLWGYNNTDPLNPDSGSPSLLPRITYETVFGNIVNVDDNPQIKQHYSFLENWETVGEGHDEMARLESAKQGALTEIAFASSSKVEYQYELNDWIEEDGEMIKGAGLRVKEMTEIPMIGPVKVTGYEYRAPVLVNRPIRISQNDFDRSAYDIPSLDNDLDCGADVVGQTQNLLDDFNINVTNVNDPCQVSGDLESMVRISSVPFNKWYENGRNYVGYDSVKVINQGAGSVQYEFLSPTDFQPTFNSVEASRFIRRSITEGGLSTSWESLGTLSGYQEPFPDLNIFDLRFGLVEKTTSRKDGDDAQIVEEVVNTYDYTLPRFYQPGADKHIYSIKSKTYEQNYPGAWYMSLIYDELPNAIPWKSIPLGGFIQGLLSLGNQGILPHPYRRIFKTYLHSVDEFDYDAPTLNTSVRTTYFDDGSSVSDSTHYGYHVESTYDKRLYFKGTYYSNGQSIAEYFNYEFPTGSGVFSFVPPDNYPIMDQATLDYLNSFGKDGGYSGLTINRSFLDGTPVSGQRIVYQKIGDKVYSKSNWSIVEGQWHLATKHLNWHESTTPTESESPEFALGFSQFPLDENSYGTFRKTITTFNDFIQPTNIKLFPNSNNANDAFERSYTYYTDFNELRSLVDENQIESTFMYDGFGRLKEQSTRNNSIRNEYTYNVQDAIVSTKRIFSDGTPTQTITEQGNGLGLPVSVTRQDGEVLTARTYDENFRVSSFKELGAGAINYSYESSPLSRLLSQTDAEDNTSIFSYTASEAALDTVIADNKFVQTETIDPNQHTFISVADAHGRGVYNRSGAGGKTVTEYDPYSRRSRVINPIGEEYTFNYNEAGLPSGVEVPNTAPTKEWYDEKFRLIATQAMSGAITLVQYDDFNRPLNTYLYTGGISLPNQSMISYSSIQEYFNSANRITSNTYKIGKTWLEDVETWPLQEDNTIGTSSIHVDNNLDDFGRITGSVTTYENDQLFEVTTTINLNDNDQVLSTNESVIGLVETQISNRTIYDDVLRPVDRFLTFNNTPEQHITRFVYGNEDRVQSKLIGGAGGNNFLQRVSYSYDNMGRLTKINDPTLYDCERPPIIEYCQFTGQIILREHSICSTVSSIVVDGESYPVSPSINLMDQDEYEPITFVVNQIFEDNGLTGELEQTVEVDDGEHHFVFTLLNSDIESLEFVLANCSQRIVFSKGDCCTPSDFIVGNGTPWLGTSNSPNLYYQEMTYDGLDIDTITYSGDCYLGQSKYYFKYDGDHRITNALHEIISDYPVVGGYNTAYKYDPAGNITSLSRYGRVDNTQFPETAEYGLIDSLLYTYKLDGMGNPTSKIDEINDLTPTVQTQVFGFSPSMAAFTYDGVGNVTNDGVHGIGYNAFNLPLSLSGNQVNHSFTYFSTGDLYKKSTLDVSSGETLDQYYVNGMEIVNGEIESYQFDCGRIVVDDTGADHIQYNIKDHLGNIVVYFEDKAADGVIEENPSDAAISDVLQRELYYPFGLQFRGTAPLTPEVDQGYLYNGKEQMEGTGLYNYGARYYDPAIARWTGVDPLADMYSSWSPYNYVMGNPIAFIDPDGRIVKPANETASNYIKHGLSVDESAYYRLDGDGNVDAAYLRQGMDALGSVGGNYTALLEIAEAQTLTEVIVADNFTVVNHDGDLQTISFGDVTIESEADVMWSIEGDAYTAQGITKEQYIERNGYSTEQSVSGFMGVTLYGDTPSGEGYGRTTNGNTQVVINAAAPARLGTKYQAHENYGHNYFRTLGRPSGHGEIKSLTSDAANNNKPL